MVRFVTTAYTHMYENDYVGLPEEQYRRRSPKELTDVGIRIERWRKEANLKVGELVSKTNEALGRGRHIDADTYWAFVRGQRRITTDQIRAIAKALGTTVHIMTHYSPGRVPKEELQPKRTPPIRVSEPARRAERKRKAQGTPRPKPKPAKAPRPYDPEEAARLLVRKFGDRVKVDRRNR